MKSLLLGLAAFAVSLSSAFAGGTLTPQGAAHAPITIRSHQVNVTLNNGFAQTEVLQTFFNPNSADLEAIYAFPVPKSASLSEVTIVTGEKTLQGEVLPKAEAEQAYAEEKQAGNDAGLATKNSFLTYEFRVSPVRANAEVKLRFVYYQPLEIDAGVARYLYPLEDGGTDDQAKSFWTANPQVEGAFSINVELKSAWPVADVRVPGFETVAATQKLDEGHYKLTLDRPGAKLDRDFVLYYRLADNLPGRVEVIPYRASKDKPGTFMMVVTPGVDLKPLTHGADYSYVLDVSGSMQGKIHTLGNGVAQALGAMRPEDRFRLVTFSNSAREILPWTNATPENVQSAMALVKS
ncbi:MAG: VIT and VWA domain-containing protein, partial [Opitutaceae bacterium]